MKIKRFYESELQGPDGTIDIVNDISPEKTEEIIKELKIVQTDISKHMEAISIFEKQLSRFKSDKKKSNDQIDDSVIQLQQLIGTLKKEVQPKIDTTISNLENYIENGRNFLL
jgi:ABC-type transporter Mla subunit MlaD